MRTYAEIIRRPLVTEKSVAERGLSRYAFEVAPTATKPAIREAVEEFFKVKVLSIHTLHVPGKRRRVGRHVGRGADWKKAIVTLKEGQKIDMLEAE